MSLGLSSWVCAHLGVGCVELGVGRGGGRVAQHYVTEAGVRPGPCARILGILFARFWVLGRLVLLCMSLCVAGAVLPVASPVFPEQRVLRTVCRGVVSVPGVGSRMRRRRCCVRISARACGALAAVVVLTRALPAAYCVDGVARLAIRISKPDLLPDLQTLLLARFNPFLVDECAVCRVQICEVDVLFVGVEAN